jgi:AbrB family looped-hinge helix DNA binding protein
METKVSTKGQVVLPKAIRDKHAWKGGTRLIVEDRPDGVLLKPIRNEKKLTIDDWAGVIKYKGPPRTIEEMDASIVKEALQRHARGRY